MHLKKYIGSREFYRTLLSVSIPIIIQNAITNFISLLDNVMVGQIGTEQMSGVSIVNQLLFVFNLCIFGALSGAGLFGAQFAGKNDDEGVRHAFRFKLYSSLLLLCGAVALFLAAGTPLIRLYLHEGSETGDLEQTLRFAQDYLAISLVGLLPYTVTQVYASTLREIKHTVPPMTAGLIGVAVNLGLNYLLIFGKLGFPAMGVEGAAIATVISRYVECAIVIVWTHSHTRKCPFIRSAYRSMRIPAPLVKKILWTGTPLLLNETVWAAGQAMLLQCYSVRGIAVVSAMNISNTVFNTFSVLFLSIGTSISILLGHRLGAGEREEARADSHRLLAFSFCMGLCSMLLIGAVASFFPQIYNTTDEVRALATKFTLVLAVASPIQSLTNASYFTLRSGGKTKLTFLFDSVYVWSVNVTLAFVLSRFTTLSPVVVYAICQWIDITKATVGIILVNKGIWLRDITA